jgi:hypothetical protein
VSVAEAKPKSEGAPRDAPFVTAGPLTGGNRLVGTHRQVTAPNPCLFGRAVHCMRRQFERAQTVLVRLAAERRFPPNPFTAREARVGHGDELRSNSVSERSEWRALSACLRAAAALGRGWGIDGVIGPPFGGSNVRGAPRDLANTVAASRS